MNITFIGIDPGVSGAIAVITDYYNETLNIRPKTPEYLTKQTVEIYDTPTFIIKNKKKTRTEYNIVEMNKLLLGINPSQKVFLAIENVHSMPKQGVRSMFTMGYGYGIWCGLITAAKYSMVKVEPRKWKQDMMPGMGKDKDASRLKASQLYPEIAEQFHFEQKNSHGRAEALLIAAWVKSHTSF